ncbi:uncharacterized protein LOC129803376 isoform X2 [Phlebotomus papatasi]|uniref:uncharacterized protein LOC129803376 isoform X2 n=1 Tax=Phlebotomus papatasi TaxID=29031 RepID=UPI002483900D|nr:uncharacterized protein LOC129803376 isoform X2 [Phlebotomus papatasi]
MFCNEQKVLQCKMEEIVEEESIYDILRRLENKVDELTRENKDLKTQCAAMKDTLDEINSNQEKVNLQLKKINKNFQGAQKTFPIQNIVKLMELEENMSNPGFKAAIETELRNILRKDDKNFLTKIATLDTLKSFNVTGRGKRKSILDYYVFQYCLEIMEMTRSDLRNHLERWQAVYRTREYRMIKKSSAKKPEMDKDKKVIDLKELTPIPKSQVPKSILSAATTLCEDLPKPFSSKVNQSPESKKLIIIGKQNKS